MIGTTSFYLHGDLLHVSLYYHQRRLSHTHTLLLSTNTHAGDFISGTKIIDISGSYKLCEDITFHPNGPIDGQLPSEDAFDPIFLDENGVHNNVVQGSGYDKNKFGLGFFAAIAISTSNVDLYLNGYTIEQSKGHALFQRFFAIIELADSPFIQNVGPAQFIGQGDVINSASNINIIGPGIIGRSAHHGKFTYILLSLSSSSSLSIDRSIIYSSSDS